MSLPSDSFDDAAALSYEMFVQERQVVLPAGLLEFMESRAARQIETKIYWSGGSTRSSNSLASGIQLLANAFEAPPPNLLPLLAVDDASIACVICAPIDAPHTDEPQPVVRWHLKAIGPQFNGAVLDSDSVEFLHSVAEELNGRETGMRSVLRIATTYKQKFLDRRPAAYDLRPIQLACQNVVIGLAALKHDAVFNGLRVVEFETCEVSHLATHEGNRALTALLLCDAFQNGGTMELRFGSESHPKVIPPAMRRFARSRSIELGGEDPYAVTPSEARELFVAVTPMPDNLRDRCFDVLDRGMLSPERLCFTLMAGDIWKAIELDYILATSSRAASILNGGSAPELRSERLPEIEICRSALMLGMLFARLQRIPRDPAQPGEMRVFEDEASRIEWTIRENDGAVAFAGVPAGALPWQDGKRGSLVVTGRGLLIAIARGLPVPADFELVRQLQQDFTDATVILVVPSDLMDFVPPDVTAVFCPERVAELDMGIEKRLAKLRVSRT